MLLFINNAVPFNNGLEFEIEHNESSLLTLSSAKHKYCSCRWCLIDVCGYPLQSHHREQGALEFTDKHIAPVLTTKLQIYSLGLLSVAGEASAYWMNVTRDCEFFRVSNYVIARQAQLYKHGFIQRLVM